MKNIFLISVCVFLFGCSNKYESVVGTAPRPALSFNKDTIRIREKDYSNINLTGNGRLTIYCPNAGHQLNIVFSDTSGKAHFHYRGNLIQNGQALIVIDSVNLFVDCDTAGVYPIDILLTDQLGRMIQKQLVVKCAANQKAVPRFFYVPPSNNLLQSWPYLFDASNSNDPDGTIVAYQYFVNGQLISINSPVMNFTFHYKGEHTIGLFLVDDLGLHSDTIYQKITIQ